MGSFKTAAARVADQRTITDADRPQAVYDIVDGERKLVRSEVKPEDWLAPGESITYWARMPHGFAADIADAATTATVAAGSRRNRAARMAAFYHPGKAALATFALGIVAINVRDEQDNPVAISLPTPGQDLWEDRVKAVMSGLPEAVVAFLQERIGEDAPESLDAPADQSEPEGETVGEG